NSSLKKPYEFPTYIEVPVRVAKLDEFGFTNVGFIKIDVEGSDMDVIEGGRDTIMRDRPTMVVELVAITHADPAACIERVTSGFGYQARIMVDDRLVEAQEALRDRERLKSFNVVFTPEPT